MSESIFHCLATAPVTSQLSEEHLNRLVKLSRRENYEVYSLIVAMGEQDEYMRLVETGFSNINVRNIEGVEVTVTSIGTGQWMAWMSCLEDFPLEHDFYASANSSFICVPKKAMREVLAENPHLYLEVAKEIGFRFRQVLSWVEQSTLLDKHKRLAKLILVTARMQGVYADGGVVHTSQDNLSRMIQCTRQTCNKLLNELEAKNLIELAYGTIKISSLAQLEGFLSS